jgi:hypothetical protein
MAKEKEGDALEAFRRYTESFQSLDPRATASRFHEPALMITPQGVTALPNAAAVEAVYGRVMAELPARGYSRTEFSSLTERRLAEDLATVSGTGVWKTASGDDLQHFGMTYTLRRSAGTWRIVVATIHAPDV